MDSTDIAVVGEALIDIVQQDGSETIFPGGSPANVAVALSRLGKKTTLMTQWGEDRLGVMLEEWLTKAGVRLRVIGVPRTGTASARVAVAPDRSATYDFDLSWVLQEQASLDWAERASIVHTGSIATVLEPGATVVESMIARARKAALVSFDPNARPSVTPNVGAVLPRVERFVELSDVVKVSQEDLSWYYPGRDPVEAVRAWTQWQKGPAVAVVTLGEEGSAVVRRGETIRVPGKQVEVADTIGAGDSFMGGLLDGLLDLGVGGEDGRSRLVELGSDELFRVLSWATELAAVTVSRPGADPPHRDELIPRAT